MLVTTATAVSMIWAPRLRESGPEPAAQCSISATPSPVSPPQVFLGNSSFQDAVRFGFRHPATSVCARRWRSGYQVSTPPPGVHASNSRWSVGSDPSLHRRIKDPQRLDLTSRVRFASGQDLGQQSSTPIDQPEVELTRSAAASSMASTCPAPTAPAHAEAAAARSTSLAVSYQYHFWRRPAGRARLPSWARPAWTGRCGGKEHRSAS